MQGGWRRARQAGGWDQHRAAPAHPEAGVSTLPAARARAVRARAVRIRAGRVVRLYSVRLPRAAFTRQRDRAVCARAVRATVLCVLGLCAQPRRDVTCHIAPCW